MNELFREIEEDIRAERLHTLWHNFGRVMVRVSIAILAGTVVAVLWQNHKESKATEQTAQLMKGLDRFNIEDYKSAVATFDGIDHPPYAYMAALQKARTQNAFGHADEARETYRALAKKDGDSPFVSLAKLLAAQDQDEPMQVAAAAPLTHLQQERRAWQLLTAGKKEEAVKELTTLADNDKAPFTLRSRAAEALATLTPPGAEAPADE